MSWSNGQTIDPMLCRLEIRKEGSGSFIANNVGDNMARPATKMGPEIWESEGKLKKASIFNRFRPHLHLRISECGFDESPVILSQ
jgi:hypothetical protein